MVVDGTRLFSCCESNRKLKDRGALFVHGEGEYGSLGIGESVKKVEHLQKMENFSHVEFSAIAVGQVFFVARNALILNRNDSCAFVINEPVYPWTFPAEFLRQKGWKMAGFGLNPFTSHQLTNDGLGKWVNLEYKKLESYWKYEFCNLQWDYL